MVGTMAIHTNYGNKYDMHMYRFNGFYNKAIECVRSIDISSLNYTRNRLLLKGYRHYINLAFREQAICCRIKAFHEYVSRIKNSK